MRRVVHVVVTRSFAGTERYVCRVASTTARRGWEVAVVGGHPTRMQEELDPLVEWRPGGTVREAMASVRSMGRQDVCHAHLTAAELVGVATRCSHRGALVSTRHFAQGRGSSVAGRLVAPWISRHLDYEIAISDFVASRIERRPDAVIHNGVPDSSLLWRPENRTVLILQRLEPEKDTRTAIRAWAMSGLAEQGWSLRIVGGGSQRAVLERLVADECIRGVAWAGWQRGVAAELARAGLLVATAPAEPFGLSVVEAMAAGVPVIAVACGAHVETIGQVEGAPRPAAYDVAALSEVLRIFGHDAQRRSRLSAAAREHQKRHHSLDAMVAAIIRSYTEACDTRGRVIAASSGGDVVMVQHPAQCDKKGKFG